MSRKQHLGALTALALLAGCGSSKRELELTTERNRAVAVVDVLMKRLDVLDAENKELRARLDDFEKRLAFQEAVVAKRAGRTPEATATEWEFDESFTVPHNGTKAMRLQIKSEYVGWYITGNWKSTGVSAKPNNRKIAVFAVKDPNGRVLVQQKNQPFGSFSFKPEIPGTYAINFSNTPLLFKAGQRTVTITGKVAR